LGDHTSSGCGQNTYSVITHPDYDDDPIAVLLKEENYLTSQASTAIWEMSGKKSAANGAVMRTSVLGIPHFDDLQNVIKNTEMASRVTHADDRCIASSVAVTVALAYIFQQVFPFDILT
jgi:ADP-ribosylglycohydrolase